MRNIGQRVLTIVLAGYVFCVIFASFAMPVGSYDDSIPMVDAVLIQQGRTPAIDFYSFYPPLGLYLYAAAFLLFGKSVFGIRVISAILYVAILALVRRLLRAQFPAAGSLSTVATLLTAAAIGYTIVMPFWPGFAISLAGLILYLLWTLQSEPDVWVLIGAGILTALAILTRVNFGGYVVAAVVADIGVAWWQRGESRASRITADLTAAAAFLIPLVFTAAGISVWIFGSHIPPALSQFIVTAQHVMDLHFVQLDAFTTAASAVALPPAWFLLRMFRAKERISWKAVPICGCVMLSVLLTAALADGTAVIRVALLDAVMVLVLQLTVLKLTRREFCLLLYYCGLLHYYLSRADWFHVRLLPVGAALLLPWLLIPPRDPREAGAASPTARGTALAVFGAAIVFFATSTDFRPMAYQVRAGFDVVATAFHQPRRSDADRLLGDEAPGRGWRSLYPDADEIQAAKYIRSRTSATESVFVGVRDHARVFWNDLRFYWLVERPIGVSMFQLEYRVATEEPFQRDIIADLEKNGVQWIILDCIPAHGDTTYAKSSYRGSTFLDDYISRNYHQEARFGGYAILRRSGYAKSG